jgi:hypothetical protein
MKRKNGIRAFESYLSYGFDDEQAKYAELKSSEPSRYVAAKAAVSGTDFEGEAFITRDKAVGGKYVFYSHAVPAGGVVYSRSGKTVDMQLISFGGEDKRKAKNATEADFEREKEDIPALTIAACEGIIKLVEQKLAELPDPEKTGVEKTDYHRKLEEEYNEEIRVLRDTIEEAKSKL